MLPQRQPSLAVRLRHRQTTATQQAASEEDRDAWIVALHLAACRRWLAYEPPALEETERTFALIRETMPHVCPIPSNEAEQAAAVDFGERGAARLGELHRQLSDLELALLKSLPMASD